MGKYFSKEIETASRETLENIQSERLVKTVKRVYDNVPAYRKRMDEIGLKPEDIRSIKDLSKLPFTYKQDLRDNYPYGLERRCTYSRLLRYYRKANSRRIHKERH